MGNDHAGGHTVRIPDAAYRKLREIADRREIEDGFRPSNTCVAATALHGLWRREVGEGAEDAGR